MSFLFKRTNIIIDEFNHICHPRKQFLLKLRHEDFTTYPKKKNQNKKQKKPKKRTPPKKKEKTKNAWNLVIWRINIFFNFKKNIIIFHPVLILSF